MNVSRSVHLELNERIAFLSCSGCGASNLPGFPRCGGGVLYERRMTLLCLDF